MTTLTMRKSETRTARNTLRVMHTGCVPLTEGRDKLPGTAYALVRYCGKNPVRIILAHADLSVFSEKVSRVYRASGESGHLVGLTECARLPIPIG